MNFKDSSNLSLTSNAVSKLMKPNFDHVTNFQPTCQVLTVKKVSMKTGPDRYKINLSDGTHLVEAVLAYKANWIATKLDSNDIFEIVQYSSVTTNTDNITIIQDLVLKQSHLVIVASLLYLYLLKKRKKKKTMSASMTKPHSPLLLPTLINSTQSLMTGSF
jgi:hypothetical protein